MSACQSTEIGCSWNAIAREDGLVTAKVCKMAIWRVCSLPQMLDLELAPQPGEVIGRHRVAAVPGMVGPVLQMLEPDREPLAPLGTA